MSRYFFHAMDGYAFVDLKGTEFATLTQARKHAVAQAVDILSRSGRAILQNRRPLTISVADEDDRVVFTLQFSADDHGIIDPADPGA
jgi:hypothetical protein